MFQIRDKREREQGKSTNFEYRGRLVGEDKLQRSRKRLGLARSSNEEVNFFGGKIGKLYFVGGLF